MKQAGLEARIGELFFGISEAVKAGKRNGLRDLLGSSVEILEHDPGIGGRYSGLSNVGLLPAAILGLDIAAIRAGAAMALAPVLAKRPAADVPSALGAALNVAAAGAGKNIAVLMAYADKLERFSRWYVQLWAESLGKDGKGTTPLGALGPVDQHSQLQLFIAGPRDKLFTVITTGTKGQGPRIDAELAKRAGEPDLGGRTMGDLVAAQGRATAETLAKNGCPVRTMHVETLNEESLGALMMHFMLETMIAAHLIGVDAFDQPAVEEGKVLAKQYLAVARASCPAARSTAVWRQTCMGVSEPRLAERHGDPHHRRHLLDDSEIEESFVRSSGPGGQNVNKLSTAVQLRFDVRRSPSLPNDVAVRLMRLGGKRITKDGVLVLVAQNHRTQERNRADALERLVALIRRRRCGR